MAEIPNYPIAVIAKLLDLSERHVRRLADDNILKKPEKNKGWEITNVTLYIRYLRERAFGKDISTTDLHNEKLRLTKAQADKATLEVNELEGELIPAQLVEDTWINYTSNVRAKLLGLPSRIAHEVITIEDYQKALLLCKEQVNEALNELGEDGIPEKYRKRNKKRKSKLEATEKNLKISDWADSYRKLSPEASAEAGIWRTDRAPYQKEIMNSFNDADIQRIVFMKSAQVGATEILLNVIGYYIDQDPAPMLILQPTLQMAQTFSKDRLSTMIRDTDKIRNSVADPRSRDSGNTVLSKKFAGGNLNIVGSNSASGLASRPIRIVLADEVDRYEASAGSEGDPISLATKRTTTFWNKKIYMCSTPTIKGLSRIETAFEESDKRYYHVPCPECNEKQVLKWKNVVWEEDQPETANYACEHCGSVIDESKKQWMLKHGEWIASAPKSDTAGFHISELYSVWSTWADMAKSFLEAKKNPEMLKTWINTALGESWEEQGEAVEYESLLQRRLNYDYTTIPEDVLILTAGVDTQKDRLELQLVGWGKNYEAWVCDYKIFWGDPNALNVWNDLDAYLKKRFKTESERLIPISCCTIDSGGHHTNMVYQFTKPRQARRIFAIKGLSQAGKPIANRPTFVGKNKAVLYGVGSDSAKEAIFARLSAEEENTTLHFCSDLDEEYFKQLTAEKRITKFVRGRKTLVWKQVRPRNEALDTLVYNFASIYILNPNFDVIEEKMLTQESKPKEPRQNAPQRGINRGNFATSWK